LATDLRREGRRGVPWAAVEAPTRLRRLLAVVLTAGGLLGCGEPPPAPMPTLLVTGFGPFLEHATNPAWEAIRELDGTVVGGMQVRTARIDVAYARAPEQLQAALDAHRPARVVCLGVAPDQALRVERVARNRDDCPAADVDGVVRRGAPIREGRPEERPTGLPVEAVLAALHEAGFEAVPSDDAGGYLCNRLFFELLERVPPGSVAGFVHVPTLEGKWDLPRLERAVRVVLETVARAPASVRPQG
jgi:pyroglutamyl-peptidase